MSDDTVVPWFVNIDANKPGDPHWFEYAAKDAAKVEQAFQKKSKSVMLNATYKVDFTLMRQVRRDDADRWRTIKRGGTAKDPAPGAASDGEDEAAEEEDKAKAAAEAKRAAEWEASKKAKPAEPVAAAAAAGKKKKKNLSDDDSEATAPAPSPPSAAAATKPPVAAAAASSSSSSSAETDRQLSSYRQQIADLEVELDASEQQRKSAVSTLQAEVDRMKKEAASAAEKNKREIKEAKENAEKFKEEAERANATKGEAEKIKAEAEKLRGEVEKLRVELEKVKKEKEKAIKDNAAIASESRRELSAVNEKLSAATSEFKSRLQSLSALESELSSTHSEYATLIGLIQPLVAVFGINDSSPLGKIIVAYQKRAGKKGTTTTAAAASSSSSAATSKKRGREEEDESTAAAMSDVEEERAPEEAKRTRRAAPAAAASVSPPPPAAAAASRMVKKVEAEEEDDADATQPMVAAANEEEAHEGAAASSSSSSSSPAVAAAVAVSSSPPPFLPSSSALSSVLLPLSSPSSRFPLCFARLPTTSPGPLAHLVLVGTRGGGIELFDLSKNKPIAIKMEGRKTHKFLNVTQKDDDPALSDHVFAIAAVPFRAAAEREENAFLVCTGEGRLFRVYLLTLPVSSSASASMKWLQEMDVREGSWCTVIEPMRAPPSVASVNDSYMAVGVSGQNHCVELFTYSHSAAAPCFTLMRCYPSLTDEVRGVCQLSDGRIVIAGCSAASDGSLDEEGAIQLRSWSDVNVKHILKHDIKVRSSEGLRCNGIKVMQRAGKNKGDQLIAAFEYCSSGNRQLMLYEFDAAAGGLDISATTIEAKNLPPADQNTYTDIQVAPDHTKAVAMTYGGKMFVFDLNTKKKLHTIAAHDESSYEDGSHCFISASTADQSTVLLSMGNAEVKRWKQ